MLEMLALAWLLWAGLMIWTAWHRQIRALVALATLPALLFAALFMLTSVNAVSDAGDNGAGFGLAVLIVFGGPGLLAPIIIASITYVVRRRWPSGSEISQDKAR